MGVEHFDRHCKILNSATYKNKHHYETRSLVGRSLLGFIIGSDW